jgi:hypothetical protein
VGSGIAVGSNVGVGDLGAGSTEVGAVAGRQKREEVVVLRNTPSIWDEMSGWDL